MGFTSFTLWVFGAMIAVYAVLWAFSKAKGQTWAARYNRLCLVLLPFALGYMGLELWNIWESAPPVEVKRLQQQTVLGWAVIILGVWAVPQLLAKAISWIWKGKGEA